MASGQMMDFPKSFDEFVKDYGFKDTKEIYTNGSELIPVFRVKQWLEHISTTKNDLTVDCISREQAKVAIRDKFKDIPSRVEINTILNELPSVTPLSSELEKNSKKLEKNFGELDCISRADAIRVASGYCHPSNVAKELAKLPSVIPQPCEDAVSRQEVLDLIADYDLSMGQVVRGIHALPSVTPQPRKGHWKLVQRGKFIDVCCSNCKAVRIKEYAYNYTIDELNKEDIKEDINECFGSAEMRFCPNCGCRMVDPQESEK